MPPRPLALVRSVPHSFATALVGSQPGRGLDVTAARLQHRGYRRALTAGGFTVEVIPGDERHPDSPFVEDTAVVIGRRALVTRPGHPTRRGEVAAVAAALRRHVPVEQVPEGARIDGGDVLQLGDRVFVGRSSRTDDAGIEALARFAGPLGREVIPVPVTSVLHLKTAVTALDGHTLLIAEGAVDPAPFAGLDVVAVPGDDPEAANVVRLPDGAILVARHHQGTADLLAGLGRRPITVDVAEFAAADGGLTCLSIRLRSVLVSQVT
jgi:dimethylargininase